MAAGKSPDLRADKPPGQLDWTRALPVLIIAAGLGVYLNSFNGSFLFDDAPHILKSQRIRQLSPLSKLIAGRRPLVDVSLAINYRVGKLDVRGYHAVNLAVHILAALTLYGVVRRTLLREPKVLTGTDPYRLTPAAQRKPQLVPRQPTAHGGSWIAFATALIWVVHPLQTQSVTYVIQRAESLTGLFYLLTLYCVIRGTASTDGKIGAKGGIDPTQEVGSAYRTWWYAAAVVSCALGMGSKAVMVTAPVVILLYDRVFLSPSIIQTLRRRWMLHVGLVATWGILWARGVVYSALSPAAKDTHVGFGFAGITPLDYAFTQFGSLVHYLGLSVWPNPLCLDYTWPVAISAEEIVPHAIVIALLLVSTIWALLRAPGLGFLAAWFFIILAPTSSIIPIQDTLFEHRMYLSLAAVVMLLVIIGNSALQFLARRASWEPATRQSVAGVLVVTVVALLGYGTARRNMDYRNPVSMWRDVVAKRPNNARAFEQLGTALVMEGNKREAIVEYRRAVRIDPDFASAHANLANALTQTGRFESAVQHYNEVRRLEPDHINACINLGHALGSLGRADEAINAYRTATQIDQRHAKPRELARAHFNLGSALGRRGDLDPAIVEYRRALRLWPPYDKAHYSLGWMLSKQGNLDEAVEHYRKVLEINPRHDRARRALNDTLMRLQRFDSD